MCGTMKNNLWVGVLAGGALGAWAGSVFAVKVWPKVFKCDFLSSSPSPETLACRSQETTQVALVVVSALVAGAWIGYDVVGERKVA